MRSIAIEGIPPRLFLFHGTGGDEHDLVPIARMIAPHNAIRSYRGIIEESGMLRWFPRQGKNVFDVSEVREHVARLMAGIREDHTDAEIADGMFIGYSNGANAIGAMLQLGFPIRRAALLHPMLVIPDGRGIEAELFVSLGEADTMIEAHESERLAAFFTDAGARVSVARFSGGHAISHAEIAALGEWFSRIRDRSDPR